MLDHGGFGGRGWLVFVEEFSAELLVLLLVFGRNDDGLGREAVTKGIPGRTLLAGGRAGAGGIV